MPEARGHAKAFFDAAVADGALNAARNLVQHRNGGASAPAVGDIVVFAPWLFNPYGHVAIVSRVDADAVEIVQQNPGPFGTSRERLPLVLAEGRTQLGTERVLGWLRLPASSSKS
ncbi:CHAP domain protein [compost metagenome]